MKSLPDFRRAVMRKNLKLLTSIFGFRAPTAEKIVTLLQGKLAELKISGEEKWHKTGEGIPSETIQVLISLGYKETHAKDAVQKVLSESEEVPKTEDLVKRALKYL
jgi:Holliday junction resolvasome RuvABC DNA-binding subunit